MRKVKWKNAIFLLLFALTAAMFFTASAAFSHARLISARAEEDFVTAAKAEINYWFAYYTSDKYGKDYIEETVYGGASSDADKDAYLLRAESCATKELADKSVKEYREKFSARSQPLKTYIERAKESISGTVDKNAIVSGSESAFSYFGSLGTLDYFDGANVVDLKTGEFVTRGAKTGDYVFIGEILKVYKKTLKSLVTDARSAKSGDYGVTANAVIDKNVSIAVRLIDLIGTDGNISEEARYSYGGTSVSRGGDIIKAFEDSYSSAGTLKNGSDVSENVSDYKNVASVVGKDGEYEITFTCLDGGGNEVALFDPAAKLTFTKKGSLTTERNINLAINDKKSFGEGVSEEDKAKVAGKVLKGYFNITITEPTDGGTYVKKTDFGEGSGNVYKVTFRFLSGDVDKDSGVEIINYDHTTVTAVAQVAWEGESMTFTATSPAAALQFAAIASGTWTDFIFIAIVGIAAILLVVLIVVLIVKSIKNKRYRVMFDANGGKYNKIVMVKHRGQFAYPKEPKRRNYVFMGWFTDKACTTRFASTELTKKRNMTVYAKWMKLADYEKLNADYAKLNAEVSQEAKEVDAQYYTSLTKDPQIEKIEAEKLSYEAKRAEEERKTEEVKLQAIREIERSKNNEDARVKAERSAEDAEYRLKLALAERDDAIRKARLDERNKTLEEMKDGDAPAAAEPEEKPIDYDELVAKVREETARETEARVRREIEEEARRKAEEEERINRLVEEKVRAMEDRRRREYEDEARRKSEEEARINAIVSARLAEMENVRREEAKKKAEDEARMTAGLAMMATMGASGSETEGPVKAVAEPEKKGPTPAEIFDELKAEAESYVKADGLGYSVDGEITVLKLREDGEVVLDLNADYRDLKAKGYAVGKGELGVRAAVGEEDVDEAKELIEEAMCANGFAKSGQAQVVKSDEKERKNGYTYAYKAEREAETPEEFYRILRSYAGSFVSVEPVIEDKPLVKMFTAKGVIAVYLNGYGDGLKPAGKEFVKDGYTTYIKVTDREECRRAMKAIETVMKSNGLMRVPTISAVGDEDVDSGFEYALKA